MAKVAIIVQGGIVQNVYSTDKETEIEVVDLDDNTDEVYQREEEINEDIDNYCLVY